VSQLVVLVQQVLAAQGRFVRQSDDNLGNWLPIITQSPDVQNNMTSLESECIEAMNQAYAAIYPCCQPSKDCNETVINSTAYYVGSFKSQLEAVGNITQAFNESFWIIEAKIGELDQNCGNMGFSTAVPSPSVTSTPSKTVAAPTVQEEITTNTVAVTTTSKTTTATTTTATTTTTTTTTTTKTTTTTTTTPAVPKTTTTAYVCCPEYADNHDCEALCALNTQVSDLEAQIAAILAALMGKKLRMRQARSAIDPELEESLLDILKEAYVVTENCVDFNICNGTHASEISRELRNIGEFFITNGLTNLSESFNDTILNLFRKIHAAVQKNLETPTVLHCPNWILTLGLDDALVGSLCLIFSDSSNSTDSPSSGNRLSNSTDSPSSGNRLRRETRTDDCTNHYIDDIEELFENTKELIGSGDKDLKLREKDVFIKLDEHHDCADLTYVSVAHFEKLNKLQELFRQLHK